MVCGAEVAEGLAGVAAAALRADLPHDFADVFFMAGMILVFTAGSVAVICSTTRYRLLFLPFLN